MPLNTFFNNFRSNAEQNLVEDLIIESIRIYGIDVLYIPRFAVQTDKLYGEDILRAFTDNYPVEMYVKNVDGFKGDGDFLSKFNIQIRDQMTMCVSRRQFERYVGYATEFIRPREADLLYFPLVQKLFEIKFVEHEPVFYQMGALQFYDLKVELFEYNNEIFDTGIENIDLLNDNSLDTTGPVENVDPIADNATLQEEADEVMDFSDMDPFNEQRPF